MYKGFYHRFSFTRESDAGLNGQAANNWGQADEAENFLL